MGRFAALLLAALLLLPSPGRAESYLDLFAGQNRAASDTVTVTARDWALFGGEATSRASRRESYSPGILLGGRIRTFLPNALWLGAAGEFSYLQARGDRVSVDALPLSLQVLLRAPLLPHPDYPVGRLHLYAGGGLSLVLHRTRADLRPDVPREVSLWSTSLGVTGLAGAAAAVTPRTFLFVEGRINAFDASVDTEKDGFTLFSADRAEVDMRSTQLLAGISWRIDAAAPLPPPPSSPPPPAPPPAPPAAAPAGGTP